MAEKRAYTPGQFCWTELDTLDPAGAKAFYTALLGWSVEEAPGAQAAMFQKAGQDVAAVNALPPDQAARGVPSHWNIYVSVADVAAASAKAVELGGSVLVPPGAVDIGDFGIMAVIEDPTGAALGLWQPKAHNGSSSWGEPGAPCWFELQTKDTERAKAFYTALFGWGTGGDERYTEWVVDGAHLGGMLQIQESWGPAPPSWSVYFQVENVDESLSRAQSLGARPCMKPMDVGTMGRCVMLADPQGALFYLYAEKSR